RGPEGPGPRPDHHRALHDADRASRLERGTGGAREEARGADPRGAEARAREPGVLHRVPDPVAEEPLFPTSGGPPASPSSPQPPRSPPRLLDLAKGISYGGRVMSDLRKDPTRGRWVLVRPGGKPRASSACPFCPGNEALTPHEIFAYRKEGSRSDGPGWSVRVIPEADPYFRIEQELVREGIGLYDRISPRGATELIVESPGHDDTAATLGDGQWEQVLWMYGERIRDLKRDPNIRDILITRRHRAHGSRITHPYSRLTAIPIIFDEVRRKLRECREHYEYKRRCVYCDMLRQEIAGGDRVVRLTDHFLALSPYAARSP